VTTLVFIDGNEPRVAELAWVAPGLVVEVAHLPSGYATAAPDPAQRARDKILAMVGLERPCFAEATDMTTLDGKSLQLELDSENEIRFCKWWREKPVRLHVCIALRRANNAIEVFTATEDGQVAPKPAGNRHHGWERLFIPDGQRHTLAQLLDVEAFAGARGAAYAALVAAITA
jgi:hypothetical protein